MEFQQDEKIKLSAGDRIVFTKTADGLFMVHAEGPDGILIGPWPSGFPVPISLAAHQASETFD